MTAVFKRLIDALDVLNSGSKFAYDENLGFITSCPTNLGTGLRSSVHIDFPCLKNMPIVMKELAEFYHVQIRGIDGEHSKTESSVFDISNKRRLGFSEVQLVTDMIRGVKAFIALETILSKN